MGVANECEIEKAISSFSICMSTVLLDVESRVIDSSSHISLRQECRNEEALSVFLSSPNSQMRLLLWMSAYLIAFLDARNVVKPVTMKGLPSGLPDGKVVSKINEFA